MNPERYQQLIAKAQEASAVNAREQNDDDATKNGPGDQASPSPAAVPHTDGDENKKMTAQKYKRKLAMAREALAANAGDQNNEDATINGPGDVAHGDAPASVASASPSRENDEDKDVSTQSSQKYEKYKKKVAEHKESQDDSTKLPALPDGAMSPAALADRPPPAQTSNRKAPSPVKNPNSAQTYSSGAAVISNPLSAESVEPTPTLRQPSVKLYVANAIVVEPSASTAAPPAPITDPISDALKVVDRFSSMYLRLGPATMSLTVLQNALAAAVARCDDAIDGPPADLPPLGEAPLGDALEYLAGIANTYMEFGSGGVPVPIVREALAKAMVRCEEMAGAEAGAAPVTSVGSVGRGSNAPAMEPSYSVGLPQYYSATVETTEGKAVGFCAGPRGKKCIIICLTVFVGIAVIVGVSLVTLLGNKNTDVEQQPTEDVNDNSFSAKLSAKPSTSLSSGSTPLLLTVPSSSQPVPSPSAKLSAKPSASLSSGPTPVVLTFPPSSQRHTTSEPTTYPTMTPSHMPMAYVYLGEGECRQGNGKYPLKFSVRYEDLNPHTSGSNAAIAIARCKADCIENSAWCRAAEVVTQDIWPAPQCRMVTDMALFAAAGPALQNNSWGGRQMIGGVVYQTYCGGNGDCTQTDWAGGSLNPRAGYHCYI